MVTARVVIWMMTVGLALLSGCGKKEEVGALDCPGSQMTREQCEAHRRSTETRGGEVGPGRTW